MRPSSPEPRTTRSKAGTGARAQNSSRRVLRTGISPPEPATARRQSVAELRELQRLALATIRHPLNAAGRTQKNWRDGRAMKDVAAAFIRPNDRLTSIERLEIYNRQYWYRLLDCLYDDYPGLCAILGDRRFKALRIAYLDRYPSRSFTLRNLGSRLVQFLQERPDLIAPHEQMCLDMAQFEWAQVVAFDGEAKPPLSIDDLLGRDPADLRLGLQPYLTALEMAYPLDDFVIAVKRRDAALRSEASNAVEDDETAPVKTPRRPRLPRPQRVFVAVHRLDNSLYYKRLEPAGYAILAALRQGKTVARACETAAAAAEEAGQAEGLAERIQEWFATWAELGWFCKAARVR